MGLDFMGIKNSRILNVSLRLVVVCFLVFSALGMPAAGVRDVEANAGSTRVMCEADPTLVGCWRMDEEAGTTIQDGGASPYNDGTLINNPTWLPGKIGNALTFNGTNQYATVPDDISLDITSAITLAAWVKPGKTGTQNILKKVTGTTTPSGYELSLSSAGKVFVRFNGNVNYRVDSTVNYPADGTTWTHIAATFDGSTIRVYINGSMNNSTTPSTTFTIGANTTNLGVGAEPASTPINYFLGLIDDARIYNRALSDSEIIALASNTPPGDTTAPAAPTALNATAGNQIANLTWTAPTDPDVKGYNIYRSESTPVETTTPINGALATTESYNDTGLTNGVEYYYTVVAVDTSNNQSSPADEASATPQADATPPAAPTGLIATAGNQQVSLSWTPPPDLDLAGYNIYRSTASPVTIDSPINGGTLVSGTTYLDSGLTNGSTYYYVVTAVDTSVNESEASNEVSATPSSAVQFNGSNQYVTFGNVNGLGVTNFTLETWFYWTGGGTAMTTSSTQGLPSVYPLISKGRGEADGSNLDMNYFLGIDSSTHALAVDFEDTATGMNYPFVGTTPVTTNTWHHAAVTYDSVTAVYTLYLDGSAAGTKDLGSDILPRSDSIQHAGLATAMTSTGVTAGFFQGTLDEARIWNYARSQEEIRATINQQVSSGSGLIARWGMNEGLGTTIYSSVGTFDGTLTNTPVWVVGAPFNISPPTPPESPSILIVNPTSATVLTLSWTDNSTNESGFEIERGEAFSGPFTLITTTAADAITFGDLGLTPESEYCYRVRSINGAGASEYSNVACGTTLTGGGYGLSFDGVDDYVTFGPTTSLGVSSFTLETWFYWTGGGATTSTGSTGLPSVYPLISKGRTDGTDGSNHDINVFLGIDSATKALSVDFEAFSGGQNYPYKSTVEVTTDEWHHAAATYDSATGVYAIYLDGLLVGTQDLADGLLPRYDSVMHAGLGTAMISDGTPAGYFQGSMDEARIWDHARTAEEIRATINQEVTADSGLVARWGLNEGSGTVAYSSVGAFPGTLANESAWVTPGAPFDIVINLPPDAPVNPSPADGAVNVADPVTLSVTVSDPENAPLDVTFYGRALLPNTAPDFSLVAIPDPQEYAATYADIYYDQMDWIVANKASSNIPFVVSLGDNVDSDVEAQWTVAVTAWNILTTGGVPYGITLGNHDGAPSATTNYNTYFGASSAGWTNYAGRYGTSDYDNAYATFSAGGMDFIVLFIEYGNSSTEVLYWADSVLADNPTKRAIVVTHDLLSGTSFTTQGSAIYNALKANENLFLMLGGHSDIAGQRQDIAPNGNVVYSLRSDYQGQEDQQSGYLRIMRFSPTDNTINVTTYSPTTGKSLVDTANQFTLAYDMSLAGFTEIGTVSDVSSGGTASMSWSGFYSGTEYEWFAVASDGEGTSTSDTWSFTTEGTANQPPVITQGDSISVVMSEDGSPTPFSLALSATDPDVGDTLTWSIAAGASNGIATADGTGLSPTTLNYAPSENYFGSDSFVVQVSDGNGGVDTITVNVTIEPVYDALGLSCVNLDPKPLTASTSDKPQSKIWLYDGSWYAVFPTSVSGASSAGTWVWKLAGTTWNEAVKLSDRTDTHADVTVSGNLAHIILWAGSNTQLASIEYIGDTYQLWSTRPNLSAIPLDSSETATIALDSTARMWLAARTSTNIVVYYSDSPYSSWSAPVVLAAVNTDDIPAITALPGNQVGVLWSDQNTQRFGFKVHTDGTDPSTWSADEVPASQSALEIGLGMADDHLNLAVASDGTLYAAVKTSYDTTPYPKMALLVRRPGGTWDDLYMVDDTGTRPLVLLDEGNNLLTYVYSQSEGYNPIVYRQSTIDTIEFDSRKVLRTGSFNDVSSMKSAYNQDFVVIYSSSTEIAGQHCYPADAIQADLAITKTDGVTTVLPGSEVTYTITASNSGPGAAVGAIVTDDFLDSLESVTWTCAGANGGTCAPSGAGDLSDLVDLPAGGSVTYTIHTNVSAGAAGTLVNTATIAAPNETLDLNLSNNTAVDTDIVGSLALCEADPTLVGCWRMEEGSGTLLADGSGKSNHASLYGSPAWSAGMVDTYSLDLNGTSQYAAVADDPTLDLTTGLTLATWIKPEAYLTQDVIKKATNGGLDGYELTLATTKADSSSQRPFFRINQVANGDTYRINAQTMYPTDGTWMHVAATYDGTTMKLYINGVLESSMAASVPIATNDLPLTLGAQDGATASRWFLGWMDDVRVYNRALTAEEILALPEVSQTISGNAGVPGAALNYLDGSLKSVTADGSGNYAITVPYYWSGTVTPSLSGYTFTPSLQSYTNVITDQTGQDYLATSEPLPPLPSSFYGAIHFVDGDGGPVLGDTIYAYVPGLSDPVVSDIIELEGTDLVYTFDVPGDMPETVGIKEGGVEGETITFKINGRIVATGIWHTGTNVELNIHPPAANAGGPYVGVVDESVSFNASAEDWLVTDTFTYAWDLDNDGAHDDSTAQNPTHTFTTAGTHAVGLKVTDSQGGEGTATTDVVVVGLSGVTGQTYDGTAKSVTVDGVISPFSYTVTYDGSAIAPTDAGSYTVVVTIKNGEVVVGTITKTMVIAKASQTITVTTHAPSTAVYGSSFTVAATTSSGLDIVYSSGSPSVCTVSGATFTMISGTGTCVVQYDQEGGTNYNAAQQVIENVTAQYSTHSIPLVPGWNLVSFNVHPASTAVADVLATVAGNFDLVYAWDASVSSGNWLKYDNIDLSPDTLATLDETAGFWIHMTDADTLEVSGSPLMTTNISLHTDAGGWNLVSYPAGLNRALPGALEDHGVTDGNYTYVYSYRADDSTDPWKLYDSDDATPPWVSDLTEMASGFGYWIFVSSESTWAVSYTP